MNVFITGAGGLIGTELSASLLNAGHYVIRLTRGMADEAHERTWSPDAAELPPQLLSGCDVLIHLAGESIGDSRWTSEKKRRIKDSRVRSTQLFAQAISRMPNPPRAWIVASATGFYGNRGDELLTEASSKGTGFLPDVCSEWEAAADPVRKLCRVVHVRTGIVLSQEGGALKPMLLPFRLGVGGIFGNGEQYWSWISLQDITRLFQFAVENEQLSGVVNGVSPEPSTNREFTKTLGRVLSRPTIFPMPAFAARLLLGEMADDLILASARVIPTVAPALGFQYLHTDLESALHAQGLP